MSNAEVAFDEMLMRDVGSVGGYEQRGVHIVLQYLNAPMNGGGSVMRTEACLNGEHVNIPALTILRKQSSAL